MTATEALSALDSDSEGLASGEAAARLQRHGPNRLREQRGISVWRLVLDEVRNPLVLILLAAAALLAVVSLAEQGAERLGDAGLILAIVVLNGILGLVQNYRAQRGIQALRRLAAPQATVVREGRRQTIAAAELVPGDVVVLEEGDRIPADGRLLEANELRVDESALTGESLPVQKGTEPLPGDAELAERTNMVYLATVAVGGRGRLVVSGTGMATEVGKVAEAVQAVEERPSRFQREVAELGRRITTIIAVLIVVIAVLQLTVVGASLLDTLITAVALAVAAIPEGLPVVLTLALAFGTRRMLERNALVRSLPVVEVLGAAEVICADKTGTITQGRMSLRRLREPGRVLEVTGDAEEPVGELLQDGAPRDEAGNLALLAAGLCNNAGRDPGRGWVGDPTEVALLVGAHKAGVDLGAYRRVAEVPFSSERKMMSVVVEHAGRTLVFSKGAPEVLLGRCGWVRAGEGVQPLSDRERQRILRRNDDLAEQGFRVLGLAWRDGGGQGPGEVERDLVFLGLAGLADPPRQAARPAMAAAARAGIRVVMITGDNLRTAQAIGREVGLEGGGMRGRELEELDEEGLAAVVEKVSVFARVQPIHKLRILQALRKDQRTVAMTGDGVNDAPALKGADVGIAMGRRGTDVARDAADMVLLDDDFATIVAAIGEGRRIFANIRKFLSYLLAGNLAEVLVILVGSLAGYLPVTAVQILWINLVTDSGPAVALAVDPPAPGLMRRPPRRGRIIGPELLARVGAVSLVIAAVVLGSFLLGLALFDLQTARTIAFTSLVAQEFLRIAVIHRAEGTSQLANRWLVAAVAVSLSLQLVLLYSPLGELFGAVALGPLAWAIIAAGLVVGFAGALGVTRLVGRWAGQG
jgi:Ca2+-transporting ATPase